jgi:hypothetical protein
VSFEKFKELQDFNLFYLAHTHRNVTSNEEDPSKIQPQSSPLDKLAQTPEDETIDPSPVVPVVENGSA